MPFVAEDCSRLELFWIWCARYLYNLGLHRGSQARGSQARGSSPLALNGRYDLALVLRGAELQIPDSLPCASCELTIPDGDCDACADQGALDVCLAVLLASGFRDPELFPTARLMRSRCAVLEVRPTSVFTLAEASTYRHIIQSLIGMSV